jgi:hypothetical protein
MAGKQYSSHVVPVKGVKFLTFLRFPSTVISMYSGHDLLANGFPRVYVLYNTMQDQTSQGNW